MSASVIVVVNQVVGVLTVPTSAVHTNGATSTVNVLKNGVSTPVVVIVGSADPIRTQITSGLSEGDTVVIATVSSTVPSTTTPRRGGGLTTGGGGFGGAPPGA
jgi:multidrug efflux pump subunit AcrA (membrane-fusion protein)